MEDLLHDSHLENKNSCLPPDIIRHVCKYLNNIQDIVNYGSVDRHHNDAIMNDPTLWVRYLKVLKIWDVTIELNENENLNLNPLNCLSYKLGDPKMARERFTEIWRLMSPIINELLIRRYNNIQNLTIFQRYDNPIDQARLLSNVSRMLILYIHDSEYKSMVIKFETLVNVFISSAINEISTQLSSKKYSLVLKMIKALNCLQINSDRIDPLESVIEFFYERYNDDYLFLIKDEQVDQFFLESSSSKRGVVHGYEFSFENTDFFFTQVKEILNKQLNEISNIFESNEFEESESSKDEIPIVLKIMEHFLNNYLIGNLIDKVIIKAKKIDNLENFKANSAIEHDKKEENSNINLINEKSLFFQCIPYLHSKLIKLIDELNYPSTFIVLDDGFKSQMDYIKVVSELINYCFESYLIEFTEELPLCCNSSLHHLINAWQTKNENTQKTIEHEIMKNVEDDESDNKFNFEIFSAFSNMFHFQNKQQEEETSEQTEKSEKQVKLSKVAARLKVLTSKVENLQNLVSIDLVVILLQHIKNFFDLLLGLSNYSITEQLRSQINQTCTNIFNDLLIILINNHIKPGFSEALSRLKNYNPILIEKLYERDEKLETVEPLNNFISLVDVGDLILQMISIFYDRELIATGIVISKQQHNRDFLKINNIEKSIKLLETNLDNYVATGLDVSIDIILNEIKTKMSQLIGPIPMNTSKLKSTFKIKSKSSTPDVIYGAQFPPPSSSHTINSMVTNNTIGSMGTNSSNRNAPDNTVYEMNDISQLPMNQGFAMEWCRLVVQIMDMHFSLLQKTIEKNIMDVFKQEVGDRFITLLIKLLTRKFIISTVGAIQFSFDINILNNFYQKHKIKPAIEYLVGFKRVDQLFLVDCSSISAKEAKQKTKELAKLVVDIGRDNGVFTPEEVYQFVTRRSDWLLIKKNVDKVVYGFGAEDCVIT
ncbi:Rcy1 protein [Martiniozyma asiatica (nom. inval.)]|nr:Rcy1 protein [Martiniozyma asiatica]